MTDMFATQRDATIARRISVLPAFTPLERAAAAIGRADARRSGARLRRFLQARPRLLALVRWTFGLRLENPFADARLEALRRQALTEMLG